MWSNIHNNPMEGTSLWVGCISGSITCWKYQSWTWLRCTSKGLWLLLLRCHPESVLVIFSFSGQITGFHSILETSLLQYLTDSWQKHFGTNDVINHILFRNIFYLSLYVFFQGHPLIWNCGSWFENILSRILSSRFLWNCVGVSISFGADIVWL